ncbi:hypothetical protein KOR34_49980 [Posidoniimonas corsicana]|uniref:Secreted protein n=1 Tax=Posidoniimonas corsicana TaxID=1938618 RepID=A0A5C5UXB7_9BACT|nr:hypothetical protein [Posidoniimonas corsicana]TWT30439.1 hypothetical protein KOR34_49980 [Posidoniimonas corsicana]
MSNCGKKLALTLLLIATHATVAHNAAISAPIDVSRKTTYLTDPLADDGLPDYSGALLAKLRNGVTPENNGGILYLMAMWPAGLEPEHHQVVCDALGMAVPHSDGIQLPASNPLLRTKLSHWLRKRVAPATHAESFDGANKAVRMIELLESQPWRAEDAPPVANYVAEHEEHYRLLHAAVKKERFYVPSPSLIIDPKNSWIERDKSRVDSTRCAARCLALRAELRIGQGDLPGAWSDCRAMYALADSLDKELVIDRLTSDFIEGLSDRTCLRILAEKNLRPANANEVLAFHRQRGSRDRFAATIDWDARHTAITDLLIYARIRRPLNEPSRESDRRLAKWVAARFDWNSILETFNTGYSELAAIAELSSWQERNEALEDWMSELEENADAIHPSGKSLTAMLTWKSRSDSLARSLLYAHASPLKTCFLVEDRCNARRGLMTVAAALAAHRCEHGDYPDSLDALVPGKLSSAPTDLFHNASLEFRRTTEGYLLYSLGPNRKDDGGSNFLHSQYLGYYVSTLDLTAEAAVCRALSEPPPDLEHTDDSVRLIDRIPPTADDHPLRMPPITVPFPKPAGAD